MARCLCKGIAAKDSTASIPLDDFLLVKPQIPDLRALQSSLPTTRSWKRSCQAVRVRLPPPVQRRRILECS